MMKKCTGKSGNIGKNVNITMQKMQKVQSKNKINSPAED